MAPCCTLPPRGLQHDPRCSYARERKLHLIQQVGKAPIDRLLLTGNGPEPDWTGFLSCFRSFGNCGAAVTPPAGPRVTLDSIFDPER